MTDAIEDEQGFTFFRGLSGRLGIELTMAPVQIAENLLNVKALQCARIQRVELTLSVYEEGKSRELTEEEWRRVVLKTKSITMRAKSASRLVEHEAANGQHFTVRDLADAITETERRTRGDSDWFGGVDVHHVYFEGIELEEDGVWITCWGS